MALEGGGNGGLGRQGSALGLLFLETNYCCCSPPPLWLGGVQGRRRTMETNMVRRGGGSVRGGGSMQGKMAGFSSIRHVFLFSLESE